jgi:hypothetical protein
MGLDIAASTTVQTRWICMVLLCKPQPCDFPTVSKAHYVFKHCRAVQQRAIINVSECRGGGAHGFDSILSSVRGEARHQICQQSYVWAFQGYFNYRHKQRSTTFWHRWAITDISLPNPQLIDNYVKGTRIHLLYAVSRGISSSNVIRMGEEREELQLGRDAIRSNTVTQLSK